MKLSTSNFDIHPKAKPVSSPGPEVRPTSLPGVLEIVQHVLTDARGSFLETYHRLKFAKMGIVDDFVQDNQSISAQGVLRGLHYQLNYPQAKLCRVVEGEALDVAVDIRVGSPSFGKWTSVLLSSKLRNQVYIPGGFAHGFLAVSGPVQFLYKCSDYYHQDDEHGIAWNDPDLGIHWGIADPIVSAKDRGLLSLAKIAPDFLPRFR